jgi:hypothetical protein
MFTVVPNGLDTSPSFVATVVKNHGAGPAILGFELILVLAGSTSGQR